MPSIKVAFFREGDGTVPFSNWLEDLRSPKAIAQSMKSVILLAKRGPELRRPHADLLRDEIRELRSRWGKVRLRILYFFVGKMAVISHGIVKKGGPVPEKDIDVAITRKQQFIPAPEKHSEEFTIP